MMEQIGLPSAEVMMRDVIDRIAIEDALADDYSAIEYQGAYTMELITPALMSALQIKFFWMEKTHEERNNGIPKL